MLLFERNQWQNDALKSLLYLWFIYLLQRVLLRQRRDYNHFSMKAKHVAMHEQHWINPSFFLIHQVKYLRHARTCHNNFLKQYKLLHCYPLDKKWQGYSPRFSPRFPIFKKLCGLGVLLRNLGNWQNGTYKKLIIDICNFQARARILWWQKLPP